MKPVRTWIIVANARKARLIEHRGVGHGLHPVAGMVLNAEAAVEYSDRAGIGYSVAGHGSSAVDQGSPQDQADLAFARAIDDALGEALAEARFDRLLLVAGPHMLGLLRKSLRPTLVETIVAELDKDLTAFPLSQIKPHLEGVILI